MIDQSNYTCSYKLGFNYLDNSKTKILKIDFI